MPENVADSSDAEGLLSAKNLEPTTAVSARKGLRTLREATVWLGLYLLLALAPLALLAPWSPRGRSFWVELGVGLGVVGFAVLALQFASTARFGRIAPFFGSDAILLFHKHVGIVAFLFLMAHPLILLFADPGFLEYLDPRVNILRALFLAAAVIGLILLVALPRWRERIGLSYEWWRLSHAVVAAGVIIVGLAHGLQVGHYVAGSWKQALWVVITASALALLFHVRVIRPWRQRRRPYEVSEVRTEDPATATLVLTPVGHPGMHFRAGQFTWMTLGDSPFSLQDHPFSFSSSPNAEGRCELTIAALGDFTSTVKDVPVGARAYLDGPYGSFTLGAQPMQGAVFIVGGIGVTPAMSMLRRCRDAHDRRPLLLIYANRSLETVTFKEELDELATGLDLRVVHVLEEPPEGWTGESGFITRDVLERHLPRDCLDHHYFVCGPPKMMDLVEGELSARGVPIWNRSVERFSFT